MPDLLACYGTLRRGDVANGMMRGCRFVGGNYIAGLLYDLEAFPGAKIFDAKGNLSRILVDVYEVPNTDMLQKIDTYEGCFLNAPDQSLFNRRRVQTEGFDRMWVWAYEYKYDVTPDKLIPTGDWFHREIN